MSQARTWSALEREAIGRLRCPEAVKRYLLSDTFCRELRTRQILKFLDCSRCNAAEANLPATSASAPQLAGQATLEVAEQFCICGLNPYMATALNQHSLLVKVARNTELLLTHSDDLPRVHGNLIKRLQVFQQAKVAAATNNPMVIRMEGNIPQHHYCTDRDDVNILCICDLKEKEGIEMLQFVVESLKEDPENRVEEVENFGEESSVDFLRELQRQETEDRQRAFEHCVKCFRNHRLDGLRMCICIVSSLHYRRLCL
jgi:hypothetical protein